jgi:tetratricopeptide (TPR) repeat protein
MAEEGRFGHLLSGDEADDAAEAEAAVAGLDPAAAAVAMQAARREPALAAKAAAYFERQARLVAIQTEHLHEQREVILANLKLKRLSERLRIGAQMLFGFAALLVVAYLLTMLHDAITSRAVIVEPFDAPPALVAGGQSGKVLASALLDQLVRMQAATRATATKRDLANSWSNDIKLEVPDTGLSFSDIERLLKARFGHDLHIGGDLLQTPGGFDLTVRGDGVLPRTFSGTAAALDELIRQAGEYVYGQTQPALFAVYLLQSGRDAEAIAFSKAAVLSAPAEERPYLYNAWAGALEESGGAPADALALERAALALKPDYWTAYANATRDADAIGDEEGAWRLGTAMERAAGGRPGAAAEAAYAPLDYLSENLLAARAAAIADADAHGGLGSKNGPANAIIAGLDADLHDPADAALRLDAADMSDPYTAAMAHYVRGREAEDDGDTAAALREMEAWEAANANPAVSGGVTSYHCFVAPAEEAAGHPARADAELAAGGHFVDCYRYRGDILDHRGQWAAARRAYAEAVAIAPDLPAGYYSWGLALARHGDLAGAIGKFELAHARGPHWADPLKAWGDVLAREGKWRAAMGKYDAALKDAPNWGALQQARDRAAGPR